MKLLYVAGIRFYAFVLRIASLFHPKAKDWVAGRKQLWKSLPNVSEKEVFWFHCASLGEFDQGLPVMNLLRKEQPNAFILVTFFSPSGYNHYHKRTNSVDFVCYIPLDTAKNAKRFVRHFKPKSAFFIKYEFWTNHILQLKKNNAKIYSISTSLRASQHYFKGYGGFFRNTLKQFDYFFAQNQTTVNLLNSIDVKNVLLTGDTRFDRVIENKQLLTENSLIKKFVGNSPSVFIAGSTWQKDEELLSELIHSNRFEKYIIAPHNVDEAHIQTLLKTIQQPVSRYSLGETESNILVIDTIGQLASAYSYASIAYVGGGFSGNLHNILEPAIFGIPVVFGPKFSRYPEAQSFIDEGIGFSVSTQEELNTELDFLMQNRAQLAEKSIQFVEKNRGASKKIMESVFNSNFHSFN